MKVRVYWNLHKDMWSVQHYVPRKGWRVLEHRPEVILTDVEWKVYAAGRERVRREHRKNVHAYAIGTLLELDQIAFRTIEMMSLHGGDVRYNPYENDEFTCDGKSLEKSNYALLNEIGKVKVLP